VNDKYGPRGNNCKYKVETQENKHGNKEVLCYCPAQYTKGVDRADQYLSYYSVLRKAVKWSKKVVLYLLYCAPFNIFFVYWTLNIQTKKVQELST
jgi:hypothetical protein